MTGQHHRTVHRVHFITAATVRVADATVQAHLIDISLMGALVAVDGIAPEVTVGSECGMTLTLGPDVELELGGRVVRTVPGKGQFAVLWDGMDVDSASHLRRLLELNLGNHDLIEQDIDAMFAAHIGDG